jgi:hypothetical protein
VGKLLFRLLIPPLIVFLAVMAIKAGVVVPEKPRLTEMPTAMIFFHCISLFGFGAKDFGFPAEGPVFWQYILVSLYFIAPLVTFVAAAEILYFVTKSFLPLLLLRGGHYLVLGYGRKGKSVVNSVVNYSNLKSGSKNSPLPLGPFGTGRKPKVVIVDETIKESETGFSLFNWNRLKLHAELSDTSILKDLNLTKCKGIFIFTNNEWLNLKLYFKVKEMLKDQNAGKKPFMYTSVTSSELIDALDKNNTLDIDPDDKFFNVHVEASKQLFDDDYINPSLKREYDIFQSWKSISFDNVVFMGFGRFSRAFCYNLIDHDVFIPGMKKLLIFDRYPKEAWKQLITDYDKDLKIKPELIECNLEHLTETDEDSLNKLNGNTLVIFGSNDESVNLKAATIFHKTFDADQKLRYIIRMCYKDSFPVDFVKRLLGNDTIFVPTYEWVEAYFEDEFRKLSAEKQKH